MKRLVFIVLAFALVFATIALVTYVGAPPPKQSTFRIQPDDNTLLVAVTPWEEAREMRAAYRPLLDYLAVQTGKKFQLLIVEDYEAAIHHVVDGTVDIAVLPPVSFVAARTREPKIQYISTIIREKEGRAFTSYRGYLIALRSTFGGWTFDQLLKRSAELRLGLVTKKSSSGWAYPMAMMKKRGVEPERQFASVTLFDHHPGVTDALVAGKVDLGATWEYNLEQARVKHGDVFTVVWTSPPIPGLAWVAAKEVDPVLIETLRRLQKNITNSSELKSKLLAATPDKGWDVVDERFYDEVREVVRYVGAFD